MSRISRRVPSARHNTPESGSDPRCDSFESGEFRCPEIGRQVLLEDKKAPARAKALLVCRRRIVNRAQGSLPVACTGRAFLLRRGILRDDAKQRLSHCGSRLVVGLDGKFAKFGRRGSAVCGAASGLTLQQRISVPFRPKAAYSSARGIVNSGEAARKGFLSSSASASRWRPILHKAWMC